MVGRGRTLLDQGQFAQAAAAVTTVPTNFVYSIEGSSNSTRQNNGIWMYTVNFFGFSVPNGEGGNGIQWRTAGDARVPWVETGDVGFDGETDYFQQEKYPVKEAVTVLASGIEARLIEAEAALQGGSGGQGMHDPERVAQRRTASARFQRSRFGDGEDRPPVPGARVLAVPDWSPVGRHAPARQAVRPCAGRGVPDGVVSQGW